MEQVKWEFSEEELNLSDFALFLSVMKNQKAHKNVLSIIMDETDRLNVLVNDILTLSKLQANADEIHLTTFDLVEEIDRKSVV